LQGVDLAVSHQTLAGRPGPRRDPAELAGQRPDSGVGLDDPAPPGSRRGPEILRVVPCSSCTTETEKIRWRDSESRKNGRINVREGHNEFEGIVRKAFL